MVKKYGPKNEFEFENEIKLKKGEISNKMPILEVEKRIENFRKEIESSKD